METTMTDTTTRSVTISPLVLASMNSLLMFAEPDKNATTPVITGLRVTRSGDDQILVVATNRYVAVRATYPVIEFADWADAEFWVDPAMLKQAVTMAKTVNMATITMGYNTHVEDSFVSVGETRFTYRQMTAQYPPVDRVFPTEEPNGAATIRLNPKWLALLSKIIVPEVRPIKDTPWLFSFFSDETTKPKPVLATMEGSDYSIGVLIQPNLIVR